MRHIVALVSLFIFICVSAAPGFAAETYDKEMASVATKISSQIQKTDRKKITVVDFTDLQGNVSELGKFLAEELTVNLVIDKNGYSVLDRANLRRILAEHQLSIDGLVKPENAKTLGQFSGVDALVMGTITSLNDSVSVSITVISVDTSETIAAAKGSVTKTKDIEQLISRSIAVPESTTTLDGTQTSTPKPLAVPATTIQKFANYTVELKSLKTTDRRTFTANLKITNTSTKHIGVALNTNRDDAFANKQFPVAESSSKYGTYLISSKLEGSNQQTFQCFKAESINFIGGKRCYFNNTESAFASIRSHETQDASPPYYPAQIDDGAHPLSVTGWRVYLAELDPEAVLNCQLVFTLPKDSESQQPSKPLESVTIHAEIISSPPREGYNPYKTTLEKLYLEDVPVPNSASK